MVIRIVNRKRTDNAMTKRKRTKYKQRSTKHTHKTKDLVTRTPQIPLPILFNPSLVLFYIPKMTTGDFFYSILKVY
jgi:hypothetical protein